MATIDKLDISVYHQYAMRTWNLELINQELSFDKASTIPPQTYVVDIYPKMSELDIIMGVIPLFTPWAYFFPPKRMRGLRRSPFAFYRVAPTLGSLKDQEEDEEKVAKWPCSSPEEEEEKKMLLGCFRQIDKINGWIGFIIGRVGQFLQG